MQACCKIRPDHVVLPPIPLLIFRAFVVFLLYGLWDYTDEEYNNDLTTIGINVSTLIFFVALLVCVTRAGASLAAAVSIILKHL